MAAPHLLRCCSYSSISHSASIHQLLNNKSLLNNRAYINREWVTAANDQTFPVNNPADGSVIAQVSDCGVKDADMAISSAHNAQQSWGELPAKVRSSYIHKLFQLLISNQEDLAKIMTLEQGKPLIESRGEVAYGASFLEWFAEEGKRVYGDIIPTPSTDRRLMVLKQPVGVSALITPWNFPIAMATRKAGAALAAGCTIILKPSEETPLSALALAELAHEAGIPKGVFNVLPASRESTIDVGGCILDDERVAKISFTGSTTVGKLLMAGSAKTVKRVSMELGGNAPFIVFNSADVAAAVNGAMAGKFRNMGQTCISPNRMYVQSGVHDEFVEALSKRVSSLKVGNGLNEGVDQGPLINAKGVDKVKSHVNDASSKGAEVLVGGDTVEGCSHGNFYQPTVLTNVSQDMVICHEETFGPVAPIVKFDEEEHVLKLANSTCYGLMSYFYSQDVSQIWRVAEKLESGMVGANETALSIASAPFGGIKQSGIGTEGSKYGISEYLNMKYLCFGNIK